MLFQDVLRFDGINGDAQAAAEPIVRDEGREYRGKRLLLVTAQSSLAEKVHCAAYAAQSDSTSIRTGAAALSVVRPSSYDLIIVDLELPDMSGAAVLRELRAQDRHVRLVAVHRRSVDPSTVGMIPTDVVKLQRSFGADEAIALIHAESYLTRQFSRPTSGSVAQRWASFVLQTIDVDDDPSTMTKWATSIGVSRTSLCECCRLIQVSGHNARDFARLVRAICRSREEWRPEVVFNLADARTLKKMLARAGMTAHAPRRPTMMEFLGRQLWIPADNSGLRALRGRLFGV